MIVFLIKSSICLVLLYVFYLVFLEKLKMHQFNRFYLLGMLLFSLLVPNLMLYIESPVLSPVGIFSDARASTFDLGRYAYLAIGIYLFVASVHLLRLVRNIISILKKVNQNERIAQDNAVLVLLKERTLPHTFLHYVFVNSEDYSSQKIEKELFTHELAHVRERHTIDVLFIELFFAIFWFNPILFFIKKSIRLNHEFIADNKVLTIHKNTSGYQRILLNIATSCNSYSVTSNLNYSLTKKRFQMMARKSSLFSKSMAIFSMLPLVTLFIFLFANISVSQEHGNGEHDMEHFEIEGGHEHHDVQRRGHDDERDHR